MYNLLITHNGVSKTFSNSTKKELRLSILEKFNITRLPSGVGIKIKNL